ncbi:cytokine receptor family member b1 isoform X2 [Salminus brasiliensis]|uniref:cytokine receptor family member b1 isoform X2 n=1 Tax=Salminus brasiliensis TaxID=930266 RepID=UPI003B83066C
MRILALLYIFCVVLDAQATDLLPTPVNVTLLSNNFNHTLSWSPGIGTPPRTVYIISVGYDGETRKTRTKKTTINVSKYMSDIFQQYTLRLNAFLGNKSSSVVQKEITPYIERQVSENCWSFYKGISFDIHLKKVGDEKDNVFKNCARFKKQHTTFSAYECFVPNLQPGGNYCVQAQPQLNSNYNTRISDWFCAFTSKVEERGVAFVAGWTAGFVLAGLGLLIFTASLVYTRLLCKWIISLPKALTAIVPGNYLSPEEAHLSVAEVDCSVKSRQGSQIEAGNPKKENKELKDEDDDDNDDNERENDCNYMDRGINDSDSQATNSGQISTSTAINFCEVAENSGGRNAEFPPVEADQPPSSSITLSQLLHKQLADNKQSALVDLRIEKTDPLMLKESGQEEGQINKAEAGTSRNINLSSVTLVSMQAQEREVSDAKEGRQPVLPLLTRELAEDLDLSKTQTGKPTLLGLQTHFHFHRNVQAELRNEELQKQKDLPEMRLDQPIRHDRTKRGYMATQGGELDPENDCLLEEDEEEEEEGENSGYMTR